MSLALQYWKGFLRFGLYYMIYTLEVTFQRVRSIAKTGWVSDASANTSTPASSFIVWTWKIWQGSTMVYNIFWK